MDVKKLNQEDKEDKMEKYNPFKKHEDDMKKYNKMSVQDAKTLLGDRPRWELDEIEGSKLDDLLENN